MEKVRKVTKKEKFEMIKEIVLNANVENENEMIEFINREIELLNKKKASGTKTAKQKENDELVEKLYDFLKEVGRPMTISEIQAENEVFGALSNQRVSALMKKLVDPKRVTKTQDKKKSYFSVNE